MAKSGRALWTAAIKEGKKSSPAGASERTEKSADSRARKKRLETERKLRGRQMCGRVLGIDPSLRGTGLAVLEAREDGTLVYIESLTVKNRPTLSMPECLARILEETDGIIRRNQARLRGDRAERVRAEFQNRAYFRLVARRGDCRRRRQKG